MTCPAPDAPDEPSEPPTDSPSERNDGLSISPGNCTNTPTSLIKALYSNTSAQLQLTQAIGQLAQSISELIDFGTVVDGEQDEAPAVCLDGTSIRRG